ncbi:LysR family transcriptional regulator [Gayadomonas joobiniege]|uniref:LysR family transcriptional regulator n=1 Tax=Gayadomonas joobiniege TaxID=1234606 RepID=UPI00036A4EA7|nr:LysR family transcriptional regulator [Gayadomonas joobiniege]
MNHKTTLEQWQAFVALVESGSFAQAAERLNKSQSSVSYQIKMLNQNLPAPVIKQQGRRAIMTEHGKVLYRRAKLLLGFADSIEKNAERLAQGFETELTIAIDGLLNLETVFPRIAKFIDAFPQTRLKILETVLSATEEAILEKKADLVITPHVPPGFLATPLLQVKMLPVAHPEHKIFDLGEHITENELRRFRQIVIRDAGLRRQQDAGWLDSEQRLTLSHASSSLAAVRAKLGFAFLPDTYIAPLLASGQLKRIPLANNAHRILPLYIIKTEQNHAGPACFALVDYLLNQTA